MNVSTKRLILPCLLLLLLVGWVVGCDAPETGSGAGEEPVTKEPVALTLPGKDWGYPSPFAFYPRGPGYIRMSLLFDTLTWKDEEGVIPWLAETWETSQDGREWTFKLHPDVKWQDGTPLTTEDVAFTYNYFKAHPEAFKWSWPVDKVADVRVLDQGRLRLVLAEPIAGGHEELIGSLPIIPRHIWQSVDDPARFIHAGAVVGSGPFRLVEYDKAEARYVYEANSDYFRGAPVVDRLIFIPVENEALALETGTTDLAAFSGKEIKAVQAFQDDARYRVIDGPSFWVLQIIFNTQRPPLDRAAFRKAIAHAIDRERIVQQVTYDGAIVANPGILSPFSDWYHPDLPAYAYVPDTAGRMLQEQGVDAVALQLTLITTGPYVREAELVQQDLAQIGLAVTVQTGDRNTVDALLREGNFDLAISGHGGIANPAMLRMPTWPAGVYHNETYERLYHKQAGTIDPERRRELVWQLQEIIADELPVLTLWHPRMWTVVDASQLDTWFYTPGGVGFGIPLAMNKLIFMER